MKLIRNQIGATLLELTMVVGIIATIAIAAIAYFNTANDANKINDEVKNVNTLSGAIRNMFNSQGNYAGVTNTVILKSGAFPDRMRVPGSNINIKHSWADNGVVVVPVNNQGTANDSFTITYSAIPERPCTDLVSKTFRYYDKVDVNGTVVDTVGAAVTSCVAGNTNKIIFTSR